MKAISETIIGRRVKKIEVKLRLRRTEEWEHWSSAPAGRGSGASGCESEQGASAPLNEVHKLLLLRHHQEGIQLLHTYV